MFSIWAGPSGADKARLVIRDGATVLQGHDLSTNGPTTISAGTTYTIEMDYKEEAAGASTLRGYHQQVWLDGALEIECKGQDGGLLSTDRVLYLPQLGNSSAKVLYEARWDNMVIYTGKDPQ